MTPGSDRSLRDPSNTTRMSGRKRTSCRPASLAACWRALTTASSSAMRAATDSASLPINTAQSCPLAGRQCGSQRAHSQLSRPDESVSRQICTSLGLCRVATCATSQRPIARGASPGPATPITPRSGSEMVTGASGTSQVTSRRCSSSSGSASVTADGRSAVPTRSSR